MHEAKPFVQRNAHRIVAIDSSDQRVVLLLRGTFDNGGQQEPSDAAAAMGRMYVD
jgi:hypothetical protein